ncbi:MAG TPA: hypothetical protein VIT92_09835 [Burkholderiaceae bacterium]
MTNHALQIGAALSAAAGLLHVAIILGGPRWYRAFGAGERFVYAARQGSWRPALITGGIALVLFCWSAYALSGAGMIAPLPLLGPALAGITAIYLLRALAIVPLELFAPGRSTRFLRWSSAVCLVYGAAHLAGTVQFYRA